MTQLQYQAVVAKYLHQLAVVAMLLLAAVVAVAVKSLLLLLAADQKLVDVCTAC